MSFNIMYTCKPDLSDFTRSWERGSLPRAGLPARLGEMMEFSYGISADHGKRPRPYMRTGLEKQYVSPSRTEKHARPRVHTKKKKMYPEREFLNYKTHVKTGKHPILQSHVHESFDGSICRNNSSTFANVYHPKYLPEADHTTSVTLDEDEYAILDSYDWNGIQFAEPSYYKAVQELTKGAQFSSNADVGLYLLEALELIALKGLYSQLSKLAWLDKLILTDLIFKFVITPTVDAVATTIDAIQKYDVFKREFQRLTGEELKGYHKHKQVNTRLDVWNSGDITNHITSRVTDTFALKYSFWQMDPVSFIDYMNMIPDTEALWNVIPLSFVADWFVDVSPLLLASSEYSMHYNKIKVIIHGGTQSRFIESALTSHFSIPATTSTSPSTWMWNRCAQRIDTISTTTETPSCDSFRYSVKETLYERRIINTDASDHDVIRTKDGRLSTDKIVTLSELGILSRHWLYPAVITQPTSNVGVIKNHEHHHNLRFFE